MPPQRNRIEVACSFCGALRERKPSEIKRAANSSCNSTCYGNHKHQKAMERTEAIRPGRYAVDPETGCWKWRGSKDPLGSGMLGFRRHILRAHRAAWEQWRGPIPAGYVIDHLCRNPSCINPDHLEPVLPRENCIRGNVRKVTPEMVRFIRANAGTMLNIDMAAALGISSSTVDNIVNKKSWIEIE